MRTRALTAATLAAVTIAGCGEKDEPETTGPVVPVETTMPETTSADTTTATTEEVPYQEVAAYFLTGVSPRDIDFCGSHVTERFLRQAYGSMQGCEASRNPQGLARESGLTVIPAQAATATVEAQPVGGVYDGDTLRITLVREGGTWLIDSVESNAPVGP